MQMLIMHGRHDTIPVPVIVLPYDTLVQMIIKDGRIYNLRDSIRNGVLRKYAKHS